jgi:uncharacterized protein YkwD
MMPSLATHAGQQLSKSPAPSTRGMVAAIALLLGIAPTLHAQRQMAPTVAEQYLLSAANEEREARGIAPLHLDPTLAKAAVFHAREMAEHPGVVSHQFPGEPELSARGSSAGAHFSLITENVAEAPSSPIIHDLWMHSPGHRANLLDPNVDSIGIAIVSRDNQLYAVEDFARTVETLSLDEQEQEVKSILAQTGIAVAGTTPAARQTCEMSTGYAGSRKPWFVMRYTAASLGELPSELKTRLSSGKYHQAVVGACPAETGPFTAYNIAVLLYP